MFLSVTLIVLRSLHNRELTRKSGFKQLCLTLVRPGCVPDIGNRKRRGDSPPLPPVLSQNSRRAFPQDYKPIALRVGLQFVGRTHKSTAPSQAIGLAGVR